MSAPKMPTPQFELATIEVEKVNEAVSNDDLLQLYALFKIATGADFASAAKPGMFDLKGKAKHNAWQAEVNAGVTPQQAAQKYVNKVEELKKSKGYTATRKTRANGDAIKPEQLARFDTLRKQLGKA